MSVSGADEIFLPYDIPGLKAEGGVRMILCHPEGARSDMVN